MLNEHLNMISRHEIGTLVHKDHNQKEALRIFDNQIAFADKHSPFTIHISHHLQCLNCTVSHCVAWSDEVVQGAELKTSQPVLYCKPAPKTWLMWGIKQFYLKMFFYLVRGWQLFSRRCLPASPSPAPPTLYKIRKTVRTQPLKLFVCTLKFRVVYCRLLHLIHNKITFVRWVREKLFS